MEFKGTKKEWKTDNKNVYCSEGCIVCRIEERDIYNKDIEAKANALLISKSSQMLEMLQKIYEKLGNSDKLNYDDYEDIESLIKSATEL